MATISVLSEQLASQIAAGEVVERPASALKELMENALDAGASRCEVAIEGGGLGLISVLDNGVGMSPEDAELCLLRHATSKLRSLSDLEQLESYGFRGEAMPSIASVSRLLLRTRQVGSAAGTEVRVDAGGPAVVEAAGCAPGTLVEVRDLFFNVPARRKFLRSTGTEAGHLVEVTEAVALATPTLTLNVKRDGRTVRQWLRAKDRRERAASWFGDEPAIECLGERGPLRVEAYLGRPETARHGTGTLRLFVNARPIRDRALAAAVAQAYGGLLDRGRYPRGIVYLDMPPSLVDFNVHPQKLELRFADPRAVTTALYTLVHQAMGRQLGLPPQRRPELDREPDLAAPEPDTTSSTALSTLPPPPLDRASRPDAPSGPSSRGGRKPGWDETAPGEAAEAHGLIEVRAPTAPLEWAGARAEAPQLTATHSDALPTSPAAPWPSAKSAARGDASQAGQARRAAPLAPRWSSEQGSLPLTDAADAQPAPRAAWQSLRFVAQVRRTYLICEGPDGLVILDQHAAAERVTFEQLRRRREGAPLPTQALLFPVPVRLSPEETECLEARAEYLESLGFSWRTEGEEALILGVPRLTARSAPDEVFRAVLAEMNQHGRPFSAALDLGLATLACHGSLRAGDNVTVSEAEALLRALDETPFAGHCPHGRPVVTILEWQALARSVGRG